MFTPKYNITGRLLANITRINNLVRDLNDNRFPRVILLEFEKTARAVSSYASTSIEGNPLPLTEVKKILKSLPANVRDSEKEVLNYNQALQYLNSLLKKGNIAVTLELILKIQRQVALGLLPAGDCGRLRNQPVVVNDPKTGLAVYLPPDAKDVEPLMKDVVAFIRGNLKLIDPLILAGIFHKQMVVIHPFMDGNGRATRLVTKVLLAQMGLNTFNLFSFENYYNRNVSKYFLSIGEYGNYYELVSSIDFTSWLEYFTEGIIDELLRVQKLLPQIGRTPGTKLEAHLAKLLDHIHNHGFITSREYFRLAGRAKPTRALDFQKLIKLGLIERRGKGRAAYYVMREKQS